MIRDRNIAWLRQSRIISLAEFYGANAVAGDDGMGAGAPVLTEVSTFGWGAGNVVVGDMWATVDLQTPRLVDPEEEIGVRVHYVSLQAGSSTDDSTWIVLYRAFDDGDTLAATATALDTTIAEHENTGGTQFEKHVTARGIINANKLSFAQRSGGIIWNVECDAMDYSADEIAFLGLEIDYKPLLCVNPAEDEDVFKNVAAA